MRRVDLRGLGGHGGDVALSWVANGVVVLWPTIVVPAMQTVARLVGTRSGGDGC